MVSAQVNAPESVTLTAFQNTFQFSVTNPTDQTLPIRIQVPGPFDILMDPFYTSIGPRETQYLTAKVRLFPALEGQSYQSTILVKIGEQVSSQTIQLHFQNVTKPEEKPATDDNTSGLGFFGLGGFNVSDGLIEFTINAFLVILLVIAIIAVAVRVRNRFFSSRKSEGA